MRKIVFLLLGALAAGIFAYAFHLESRGSRLEEHEAVFEDLRWLRTEFGLEPAQMEAINRLYEEYRPVCEAMCLRVMNARERLDAALAESREMTPELGEALADYSRVKAACHRAMLEHVYEVAAHMTPEQRDRYLERAKTHITMHDSAG